MSTQSGITASEKTLQVCRTAKSNNTPLIIRVDQENTSLQVDLTFKHSTTDFFYDVANHLYETHPHSAYLVIPVGNDDVVFASFIPDEAPIREKMLYASTKNSFLTQLGSGLFKKHHVFAWSEIKEVSHENFVKETKTWALDSPLTEEERLLGQIKSLQNFSIAELQAQQHAGYKRQLASMHESFAGSTGTTSGIGFKPTEQLDAEFKSFGKLHQLLTFSIDLASETVALSSSSEGVLTSSLISNLSTQEVSHPQYALYAYSEEKAAFIYSCPSGSKVKERIVYASNKKSLVDYVKATISQTVDKNIEIGDLDELDIREFEEQKEETATNRLKFNKPKGPRRR